MMSDDKRQGISTIMPSRVYLSTTWPTLTQVSPRCPQKAWNVITTDLRGTCPLNNLARDMAQNKDFDIYRLYITHALPGIGSSL